jgi:hypothetical protein
MTSLKSLRVPPIRVEMTVQVIVNYYFPAYERGAHVRPYYGQAVMA